MAIDLKIQGNFLILTDTSSSKELLIIKRSEVIPTKKVVIQDPDPTQYLYTFVSTTYVAGSFKDSTANQIEFNDFIDNRTGLAFNSVSELDEFLRLNLGGVNAPVQVLKYTGWAVYTDSTYTELSPRTINNEAAQITIDALGSETYEGQLPADAVNPLWDTVNNKIAPIAENDAYSMRIAFTAKMFKDSYFSVYLDIGDGSTIKISGESKISPNTTDAATDYSFDVPIFARSTFIANGGKIYIDNTDDASSMDAYDFSIFLIRIHKAN